MDLPVKNKRKWAVAAGLVAAVGVSAAVLISLALPGKPTLRLEGAEMRRAADGSTQLLATLSIENIPTSGGIGFLTLKSNNTYLIPSDYATNKPYDPDDTGTWPDPLFVDNVYRVDPDLYEGDDPFEKQGDMGCVMIDWGVDPDTTSLYPTFQLKTSAAGERKGYVCPTTIKSEMNTDEYEQYIDAEEKAVALVQLSYWVDPNHRTEMIENFNGKTAQAHFWDLSGADTFGVFDGKGLITIGLASHVDGDGTKVINEPGLPYWDLDREYNYTYNDLDLMVSWDFEDTLIDAVSARDEVTINAYEAYDSGTPLDLADALLRYSPTVRGTHLIAGTKEDFTLYWGGADGCDIITAGNEKYHLTRTYTGGAPDGGYTLQKYNNGTSQWETTTDTSWYSPQGGSYTISQLFRYDLGTGEQVYPDPIQVKLTVTPVTVTGVTADPLRKTYQKKDAPDAYDKLKLPGTAQLITDVVPGTVSLTIPVTGWESVLAPGTTIASDLSDLKGMDGTAVVNWNEVGLYSFQAVPVYNDTTIHVFYPWLTVPASYTLEGERRIVPDNEDLPEYEIYFGETTYGDSTNGGLQTLKVAKKVNGSYEDMSTGDTFRLQLPGGAIVDSSWFATTGTYLIQQNSGDPAIDGKISYTITLQAGRAADAAGNPGRELVRRSVNLGGYFQVAVTEPGAAESDFVGRYVGPRPNYYGRNYTGVNVVGETLAGGLLDFTGVNAGLYPFYRNSTLPVFVTLPAGYSVETTYDGLTGAEVGYLNRFKVELENTGLDRWSHVRWRGGSTGSAPDLWNPAVSGVPMVVNYGHDDEGYYDHFAASHTYSGYGLVTNRYNYMVEMLLEVQDERIPPIPEPSLRLTYEEYGDAVTTTPNGEVERVIFNTKQVGYTTRQNVTLTLTNTGTADITGIYIDAAGEDAHGNEFIITQQPASDLPAGASTTFKVSYVLNLSTHDSTYPARHTAIDTPIRVYTDASPAPAKTFETELTITDQEVYNLQIVIDPADGSKGTAMAVKGPTGSPAALDSTPVPYSFPAGTDFYIWATPKTDCSVAKIYYLDGTTQKLLTRDTTTSLPGAEDVLATWTMPSHDMVVYVVFEESIYSRLRLIDIQDWSGVTDSTISHQLPLLLHTAGTGTAGYSSIRTDSDYDMTTTPGESVLLAPDSVVRLTESTYVVVIPADADRSQVRLTLQGDPGDPNLLEPDIQIRIDYGANPLVYDCTPTSVQRPADYTKHTSACFDSPAPGEQRRAYIRLTYKGVSRDYTLIIARRFDPDVPLTYPLEPGNSPYGMIQWDDSIADKDAAKAEYRRGDRFVAGYIPAKAGDLTLTYWQQAWEGTNYDRMDEALFVFAGESFDDYGPVEGKVTNSAGDPVAKADISRRLTGLIVPGSGSDQKTEFETATAAATILDFGTTDQIQVSGTAWEGLKVRPGIYALEYCYEDFDGTTMVFTRPLIVLSRLGDLDQSLLRDGSDGSLLEHRITAPLGYEATGYPERQLFRSRVCDVNNDRNINQIDANGIYAGAAKEYYLPVGYGK